MLIETKATLLRPLLWGLWIHPRDANFSKFGTCAAPSFWKCCNAWKVLSYPHRVIPLSSMQRLAESKMKRAFSTTWQISSLSQSHVYCRGGFQKAIGGLCWYVRLNRLGQHTLTRGVACLNPSGKGPEREGQVTGQKLFHFVMFVKE